MVERIQIVFRSNITEDVLVLKIKIRIIFDETDE